MKNGMSEVEKVRQIIHHYEVSTPTAQVAELGSSHREILSAIVDHYKDSADKRFFESLASLVANEFFGEHYSRGWITKHSGDMGVDFIGRLEIKNQHAPAPPGTVLGGTRILVFGQAKCRTNYETAAAAEDAKEIARVAARLQRGYLGVFVTTGTYKQSKQKEVAVDGYPIVLINGRQLADLLIQYIHRTGKNMKTILSDCDQWYLDNQRDSPPENFLKD